MYIRSNYISICRVHPLFPSLLFSPVHVRPVDVRMFVALDCTLYQAYRSILRPSERHTTNTACLACELKSPELKTRKTSIRQIRVVVASETSVWLYRWWIESINFSDGIFLKKNCQIVGCIKTRQHRVSILCSLPTANATQQKMRCWGLATIYLMALTILVALDQSVAFDCIEPATMIRRLQRTFGVTDRALEWLTSYLQSRRSYRLHGV